MHSSFKSNLRMKTSEQLMNMVSNKGSWSKDQFELILKEVENRGLSVKEVETLEDNEDLDFYNDMQIIEDAVALESKRERFHTVAFVVDLIITLSFAFILFGGVELFRVENQLTDAFEFVFIEYLLLNILWFFLIWGLFIGRKYLFSLIASGGLVVFLAVMSLINY